MRLRYDRRDILSGACIYAAGDTAAALVLGRFSLLRLAGMAAIGATLYAIEVPTVFRWIDRRTRDLSARRRATTRTLLALLYFNPLWIARHLLFIRCLSMDWTGVSWELLRIGVTSWLVNIPLSALGNYVIQVRLPLRWRFVGSATFSGVLAVYYALSEVWFGG